MSVPKQKPPTASVQSPSPANESESAAHVATILAVLNSHQVKAALKALLTPVRMVFTIAVAVLAFFGGQYIGQLNIRTAARAEAREVAREVVMAEKFIGELAEKIRPGCVFDSTGTITANFGAAELIERIQVDTVPESFGFKITMKFKKLVEKEPIVTGLSVNVFPEEAKPGPMNTWTFSLGPATTFSSILAEGGSGPSTNHVYKFKLEILH